MRARSQTSTRASSRRPATVTSGWSAGELAGQFLDAGLLDEVVVTYAPVTLGAGTPLLPRRCEWTLVDAGRLGAFAAARWAVTRPE